MAKVTLQGHIEVPDEDLAKVKAELPKHIELTRAETGCLTFNVDQDPQQPGVFYVYEVFCDDEAFAAHQARVAQSAWGAATTRVIRHYEINRGLRSDDDAYPL